MDDEEDIDIGDIVQDLKGKLKGPSSTKQSDLQVLDPDKLEEFILNMAKTLSVEGLEAVQEVRDELSTTPGDAEAIAAFGSLLNSAGRALDTLTKLQVQRDKNKAAKELKELDLKAAEQSDTRKLIMNREVLIERMLQEANDIEAREADVTIIESKPLPPSDSPQQ